MAKATLPHAAISAFRSTGIALYWKGEEEDLVLDHGQSKRLRHWHEGTHVEGRLRREEKRKISLKWKQNETEIRLVCQPFASGTGISKENWLRFLWQKSRLGRMNNG
jgi:hypothetical protein